MHVNRAASDPGYGAVLAGGFAAKGRDMISRRTMLGLGLGAAAAATGAAFVGRRYADAMADARARISPALSHTISTRFGTLEYAEAGEGPAILVIHGSGGGFDQGLLFGAGLAEKGYRVIAPSRFGYLGSDYPEDASPENQADALAELLVALGLERAAVAGLSAGALSALAFAIRHPERCAALLPIVPASYVPGGEAARLWSPIQEVAVNAVLRSDFLFWCGLTLAPDFFTSSLLATDPALVAALGSDAEAAEIRQGILPVSARARGLVNDMQRSSNPPLMAFEEIAMPTYAFSAEDDRYGTAAAARFIAQAVPGAHVHVFPTGGHILAGRQAEFTALVDGFLKQIGYAPA